MNSKLKTFILFAFWTFFYGVHLGYSAFHWFSDKWIDRFSMIMLSITFFLMLFGNFRKRRKRKEKILYEPHIVFLAAFGLIVVKEVQNVFLPYSNKQGDHTQLDVFLSVLFLLLFFFLVLMIPPKGKDAKNS